MTVVVAVACPDAIVLASESRTTQRIEQHHRIASNTAQKVFALWGRFGAATYGVATIDRLTVKGLIADFVAEVGDDAPEDTEGCANALGAFFAKRLAKAAGQEDAPAVRRADLTKQLGARLAPSVLGFLVAGHDPSGVGVLREVRVAAGHHNVRPAGLVTDKYAVTARGQDGAITRLLEGVDWRGLDAEPDVQVPGDLKRVLKLLEYDLIHPVTLSDAAELAEFLVDLTIKTQRFTDGTFLRQRAIPGCGGPIQMLACTPSKVEWLAPPVSPSGLAESNANES